MSIDAPAPVLVETEEAEDVVADEKEAIADIVEVPVEALDQEIMSETLEDNK